MVIASLWDYNDFLFFFLTLFCIVSKFFNIRMYFTERCIKIKFTYHTVQLFRTFSVQFKIYNSMLGFFLHIYRVVQPLPQTNFRKLSSSPKKTNVYPPKKTNVYLLAVTLHSDPLLCQQLIYFLSLIDLPTLDVLYEQNHTIWTV